MALQLQVLVVLVSLFLLTITLELVRRGKLREEYSLVFLMMAGAFLVLAVFSGTLQDIALYLGIGYGPSLAFGVSIVLIVLVLVTQGVMISTLSLRNRDLAQKVAELEWQIAQLRRQASALEEMPELAWPEPIQEELAAIREKMGERV